MATIREGNPSDVERVNSFYASLQRGRGAKPGDFLLLAENDGEVVGAVRLCHEEGFLVLRGMLITADYRGQGVGARMLRALEPHMRGEDCYCLPWAHLVPFYRLAGFEPVTSIEIPDFLAERLRRYREELRDPELQRRMQDDLGVHPPDGLGYIAMKRPAG